jgi:hypothetical protein
MRELAAAMNETCNAGSVPATAPDARSADQTANNGEKKQLENDD